MKLRGKRDLGLEANQFLFPFPRAVEVRGSAILQPWLMALQHVGMGSPNHG